MYAWPLGPHQKFPPRRKLFSQPHRLPPSANEVLALKVTVSKVEQSVPDGDVSCPPRLPVPIWPYCCVNDGSEKTRKFELEGFPLSERSTGWVVSCQLQFGSSS